MDHRAVRKLLQDLRFERRMDVPALAEEAGLAKSTLYRLEEIEETPSRTVDLDTLERLTAALGITLSEFFRRIELSQPQPPRDRTDADSPPPEAARERGVYAEGGKELKERGRYQRPPPGTPPAGVVLRRIDDIHQSLDRRAYQ